MSELVTSISTNPAVPNFDGIAGADEIQSRFIHSARSIILGHELVRGDQRWQITALELYLFHPEYWPDPNTDKSREQLEHGKWYVRRVRSAKRWRIDITAGSNGIHAGLLIAAIGDEDGSGRALNTILHGTTLKRIWGYSSKLSPEYKDAEDNINSRPVDSSAPYLHFEKHRTPVPGTLWIGPRKNANGGGERFKRANLRIGLNPPCAKWQWTKKNAPHFQVINFRPDQSIFLSAAV